jgi:hypothetical protein
MFGGEEQQGKEDEEAQRAACEQLDEQAAV